MQINSFIMLRPTNATILFFRKNRLHVATVVGIYEIWMESSDNGLNRSEKRNRISSAKTRKRQSTERNNNLNAGPKSDKIAKDTINAPKSRNSKNPSFVVPDWPTIF